MTICFDLTPGVYRRGGIGRYADNLYRALNEQGTPITPYINLSGADTKLAIPHNAYLAKGSTRRWRLDTMLGHAFKRPQRAIPRDCRLFHATDNTLPFFKSLPTVFTLHDLVHHYYPDTISAPNRLFLKTMLPTFLRRATHIVAHTHATAQSARKLYKLDPQRLSVVHSGVGKQFRPITDATTKEKLRHKLRLPQRFLLTVGTIEPRKNLITLFNAYKSGAFADLKLVVVGKHGWRLKKTLATIENLNLTNDVMLTGYVPDDDLPTLYSMATVFVFPSLYEGFGFPIIEAMACGSPVITSDRSSMPEIAGNAAYLIDPTDPGSLADAIDVLIQSETEREQLRQLGFLQAKRYSWQQTAKLTSNIYQSILKSSEIYRGTQHQ